MKESPTGVETTTGSNPAGVAAQTTPEDAGNPDRTELRSVATPEDPRGAAPRETFTVLAGELGSDRYKLECNFCGDVFISGGKPPEQCSKCGHYAVSCEDCGAVLRNLAARRCDACQEKAYPAKAKADQFNAGQLVDKDGRAVSARRPAPGDLVEFKGRDDNWFRVKVRAIDAEGVEAMTLGDPPRQTYRIDGDWRWPDPNWAEWPESEEVRRCTAIVVVADEDHLEDECGAVIGKDVHCGICEGRRCYQHCASLDHFKGNIVDSGTAANGSLEWQVVEFAAGRFAGQIQRGTDLLAVVGLDSQLDRDQVVLQLEHRVKLLELGATPTAQERRRRDSGRQLHAGLFDVLAATQGRMAPAKRVELVREVIDWLRQCDDEWKHFRPMAKGSLTEDVVSMAEELHRQQVLGLFSRLAGAL